jgi:DNA-binding NarL/FixJ family response regulator
MELGAVGFIAKACLSSELLSVLNRILAGEVCVPTALLGGHDLPGKSIAANGLHLTARQQDVLALLLDGRSNKFIGDHLQLSDETVKNHVSAVLRAFGVQTRIQAVLAATEQGYVKAF